MSKLDYLALFSFTSPYKNTPVWCSLQETCISHYFISEYFCRLVVFCQSWTICRETGVVTKETYSDNFRLHDGWSDPADEWVNLSCFMLWNFPLCTSSRLLDGDNSHLVVFVRICKGESWTRIWLLVVHPSHFSLMFHRYDPWELYIRCRFDGHTRHCLWYTQFS